MSNLGDEIPLPCDDRSASHSHPLINITPKPSAVFSADGDVDSDIELELESKLESKLDDGGEWDEVNVDHCEQERGRRKGRWEATAAATATGTRRPNLFSYSYSYSRSWKTRILELFVIQIVLLVSIAQYVQNNGRLSLSSSIIVEGSETTTSTISVTASVTASASMPMTTAAAIATNVTDDCIYVPGGGFSGFWFSLGRLQSLENPHNETFVCYSAGCLGVVATLLHHGELAKNGLSASNSNSNSNDTDSNSNSNSNHYLQVYEMARSIQLEWQAGKRHRYRVVETFIDGLLDKLEEDPDDESRAFFLETIRSKLNIVTTTFDGEDTNNTNENLNTSPQLLPESILPRAFVRRPSDIPSLKRLLLQSAWIPLATGSSWTHRGHMDGGFSKAQHPRCARNVDLQSTTTKTTAAATTTTTTTIERADTKTPSSWHESLRNQIILWVHALNIEISQEDVDRLWRVGMEHGV